MPYPSYKDVELPLLELIYKTGGSKYEMAARDTYRLLAEHFGLSKEEQGRSRDKELEDGRNESYWHNMVQYARRKLMADGYLSKSVRGVWRLSETGIALVHSQNLGTPADVRKPDTIELKPLEGEPAASAISLDHNTRNAAWSRDELILALDLYLRFRASPPGKQSAEVSELSEFLNLLGQSTGQAANGTYRNPNGVYMKLMNFRRFDQAYTSSGKIGLARGNRDEELVWQEFAGNSERLRSVVAAIRQAIASGISDDMYGMDEPDIYEAEEGKILTRLHRIRERSRTLVEECKRAAIKLHGKLSCEACGLDFSIKYGAIGTGIIEVHHKKPVHTLKPGDTTKLQDLALLCANCHRVVHSRRRWLTVDEVRAAIQRHQD